MITKELKDYILSEITKGTPIEIIKQNLLKNGWNAYDISEVFIAINIPSPNLTASNLIEPDLATPSNQKIRRSKKVLSFVAIFILLLLIGGGVYGYVSGYFVSLERITTQAFERARQTKSGAYDITISMEINNLDTPNINMFSEVLSKNMSLTTTGSFDFTDAKNPKLNSIFSFVSGATNTKIELRTLDKILYASLLKAPSFTFLPILSQYENKWVSFDYKNDKTNMTSFIPFVPTGNSILNGLTDDQKEHLWGIARNSHFIKVLQKLPPETITGENSYHFTFDLDKEGIRKYLEETKKYINSVGKNDSYLSSLDLTIYNKQIENITNFSGETWIGKNDKIPHKLKISADFVDPTNSQMKITISLTGIFSDWNKIPTIVVPEKSQSFEEFINEFSMSTIQRAQEKGGDDSIKTILTRMRPEAEIYYDSNNYSYIGFCKSKNFTNFINTQELFKESKYKPICFDKNEEYAISAPLEMGGYFCIDSTGTAKDTNTSVVTTKCPAK